MLALTLESDLIIFKEKGIDPSQPNTTKTCSELRSMYQLILKDYKLKLANFKKSGTHESDFHNFTQGRFDTYYMHVWMLWQGPSTLEGMVGALPDAAKFDSGQVDLTSTASFSNLSGSVPRAKKTNAADAMNRYIDIKQSQSTNHSVAANTKAMTIQLETFMNGCNQLLLLEEKTANEALNEAQQKIVNRMSSVVGSAVSNLETHINSGTLVNLLHQLICRNKHQHHRI